MKRASVQPLLPILLMISAPLVFALDTGAKAPPFVNLDLNQQQVWSRDYLGKKWVILDFFATDCEACTRELPVLERLQDELAARGLTVLVFATDPRGEEVVRPYFQKAPTSLSVLLDNYQMVVKRYEVKEIPSLFLVDAQGVIVHKEVGFREDLYQRISALLLKSLP